ncbi:MAG: ATP synthase F1 subunit gamma [Candidatus Portnoybacteria bacterium RIFCSPLOWO2_12_FULL_39_9]|uniref:ATP synthase gamma chain n=1 Tax=Candidatus Portnoybacteria bacterium RIFCSPHIGHO2_12_FULL_38_9 TaxID=1801997 RepID=A0A1G2FHW2_9BACT|nr:MAG: ATP synthase F1 subunit gamma [Candidatus Portnoybacteria bacterium RBG_13_40_8]OGZ37037.1 MAG: ATP synthase F1 subunit gamma [Candidatus Portnoybacteria bacterium RIFCSPHIGHO2_02_FULL_39_12]OGZ37653.1 MAG: ATP synthase F1 subunit gamma [Candidatus Portnoybacteria bacterium RIFCSPHIGHO2_12_FULL_38_9]OGZ37910.1 MAG: ATP synthase F1 subunit gamma [Candidatus Portnoybacteria bacterium RIFCSPLOWO2_01_FULL_38_39]OGZ40873.1 MAG: ATP synthase F1 subunit gamma [Candidatus Portnoybacteria bacter
MALNTKDIKRRKKSISNIGQIAKAMEIVSVTKMRRSQAIALATRPYTKEAMEILKTISQRTDPAFSYFLEQRPEQKIAVLLISADKGLCGGLNSNIFRKTEELLTKYPSSAVDFVVIGKKGAQWCERKKLNVIKSFFSFGDYVDFKETLPVSEFIIDVFRAREYDAVWAVYTNFLSALKQETTAKLILPLKEEGLKEIIAAIVPVYGRFANTNYGGSTSIVVEVEPPKEPPKEFKWEFEYKFEPDIKVILDDLLYNLTQVEIYYVILESNASEHSARRLAMKNASDNAENIITDLNLLYNKARQAAITQEISEIAAGSGEL